MSASDRRANAIAAHALGVDLERTGPCSMCDLYEIREMQHRNELVVLRVRLKAAHAWKGWCLLGWLVLAILVAVEAGK